MPGIEDFLRAVSPPQDGEMVGGNQPAKLPVEGQIERLRVAQAAYSQAQTFIKPGTILRLKRGIGNSMYHFTCDDPLILVEYIEPIQMWKRTTDCSTHMASPHDAHEANARVGVMNGDAFIIYLADTRYFEPWDM